MSELPVIGHWINEVRRIWTVVGELQREFEQLRRERRDRIEQPREVRWVITSPEGDEEEATYPGGLSNTFPIKFLDCSFAATPGLQTFDTEARSAQPKAYAHTRATGWIPPGWAMPAFRYRGQGTSGDGEWWLLEVPTGYYGKLQADMAKGQTKNVKIWLPNFETGVWEETAYVLPAEDRFLGPDDDPIETGTWVKINWHFVKFVVDNAGCAPDA